MAISYYFKSLHLKIEILGENNLSVADSYNNIGNIYDSKNETDQALQYHLKSLKIKKELLKNDNYSIAQSYNNIGLIYKEKKLFDNAIDWYLKSNNILISISGEKNYEVAGRYHNIGIAYWEKLNYDSALYYFSKALDINKSIFVNEQAQIAMNYTNIGHVYSEKKYFNDALRYYQKGISYCLHNDVDTINVIATPLIRNAANWYFLLRALQSKAKILADTSKNLTGFGDLSGLERMQIALYHYQACDTLIDLTRIEITGLSDKIALAEQACEIYEDAIPLCENLTKIIENSKDKKYYDEMAFYFSEKNKSSVLLEALAGQEALKFTGIPADLLKNEHDLKTDISFYTKQLAEPESLDSIQISKFQNMLFDKNRSYDSLIIVFETRYPKYHELKYNSKPVSLIEIQKQLDRRTAMISYTMSDSSFSIFTIRRNKIEYQESKLPINFNDSILLLRKSLTENSKKAYSDYKRLAQLIYETVFPKNLDEKIENLIIIPDNVLATIPFEALLTNKANGTEKFSDLPYLLRKFNISYSYSATLFNRTFPKEKNHKPKQTPLNDWLAFAPVFSDENTSGISYASRELLRRTNNMSKDSSATRGFLISNGNYINPLPGTINEVKTIFSKFDQKQYNAKIELNENASESLLKSDEIKKYKMLHFATHGFVNSEKPELSGLLLSQIRDTSITEIEAELNTGKEQNDGILYSGEIYNLELNADLVVLSASETGLGKIKKGEGIIRLTRALLYAGAKNIVVSLWQVSDESTSQLMINFYDNILENGLRKPLYSKSLRKAKLKMISEQIFAHPYFWSPFILIGK